MIEQLLAGIGVTICAVMLARMALGERRTAKIDAITRRWYLRITSTAQRWYSTAISRRHKHKAAALAEKAIRRARYADNKKDGTAHKPKASDKPRKLH